MSPKSIEPLSALSTYQQEGQTHLLFLDPPHALLQNSNWPFYFQKGLDLPHVQFEAALWQMPHNNCFIWKPCTWLQEGDHTLGVREWRWVPGLAGSQGTCEMIKLIISVTEQPDSPNWWAQCTYRCSQEFSGGKLDQENMHQWDWKIPSMKMGWQCHLIIKQYPQTKTILRKYDDWHDHPLGNENLQFLRLSYCIRSLVMDVET